MAINLDELQKKKTHLQKKTLKKMKTNINVEIDFVQMKTNMNAINGAIQQTDKLVK